MNQACDRQLPLIRVSSGAVLLFCIMLLAAVNLLGLAAASDYFLQERMSNNLAGGAYAEQSANAALEWGEAWLMSLAGSERPVACNEPCAQSDIIRVEGAYGPTPQQQDPLWWQQHGFAAGHDPVSGTLLDAFQAEMANEAYWLIEEIHLGSLALGEEPESKEIPGTELGYYRIYASGSAQHSMRFSVTQSIVARPWGNAAWTDVFPRPRNASNFCYRDQPVSPCGRVAWRMVQ